MQRGEQGPHLSARFSLVRDTLLFRHATAMFGADRNSEERLDVKVWLSNTFDRLCHLQCPDYPGPPTIPESRLDLCQQLHDAVTDSTGIEHFLGAVMFPIIAESVRDFLLVETAKRAYANSHWWVQQRFLFQFFLLGTFGVHELKRIFRKFEAPTAFESHVTQVRDAAAGLEWHRILWMMMPSDDALFVIFDDLSSMKVTVSGEVTRATSNEDPTVRQVIWEVFSQLALHYPWKGRRTNCFGMSNIDYDVASALLGKLSQDSLTSMQQDIFKAACNWKNLTYAEWNKITERPELPVDIDMSDSRVRVNISDAPRAMDEDKPRMSFVFLGEKNAGKSTLAGRLICGTQSSASEYDVTRLEALARKYNKEGNEWAWVMDRLREERETSSTIKSKAWNIGTPSKELDLLDAPGERSFLNNLMQGAALADAAVLVVSARAGEFEKGVQRGDIHAGQPRGMTYEEPDLAYALGITHLIVVVNKMDHSSVNWSQARFAEITAQLQQILKRTKKYLETTCFIPVAGYPGHNITTKYEGDDAAWYDGFVFHGTRGHTLLDALDAMPTKKRPGLEAPLCMPIMEVLPPMKGVGTIIVGCVQSGQLQIGSNFTITGHGESFDTAVKSMELYHTKKDQAVAGDRVALSIRGSSREMRDALVRGMVACPTKGDGRLEMVRAFEGHIQVFSGPGLPSQLKVGFECQMFVHTGRFLVRIARINWKLGKETGGQKMEDPASIQGNEMASVNFTLEQGAEVVANFHTNPELGRFVISCGSAFGMAALGVGKVVATHRDGAPAAGKSDPAPPPRRLGRR
jgi:elongation factor 1-alpha